MPAEILTKPGRLTEIEMILIRQHAAAGAETVADIDFEGAIAEMIRQHHERLDGSGYPAGLTDDEILPEARILAVADVVEAMISHRPYRPALSLEEALAEIESGAGTRYDAEAAAACVRLFREKGFSAQRVARRRIGTRPGRPSAHAGGRSRARARLSEARSRASSRSRRSPFGPAQHLHRRGGICRVEVCANLPPELTVAAEGVAANDDRRRRLPERFTYGTDGALDAPKVHHQRRLLQVLGGETMPLTAEHVLLARTARQTYGKGNYAAGLNIGDCCAYVLSRHAGFPLLAVGEDFPKTDVELAPLE